MSRAEEIRVQKIRTQVKHSDMLWLAGVYNELKETGHFIISESQFILEGNSASNRIIGYTYLICWLLIAPIVVYISWNNVHDGWDFLIAVFFTVFFIMLPEILENRASAAGANAYIEILVDEGKYIKYGHTQQQEKADFNRSSKSESFEETQKKSGGFGFNASNFSNDKFNESRFSNKKKKQNYEAACHGENDTSVDLDERTGYYKYRQLADEGKINGIKPLTPKTN